MRRPVILLNFFYLTLCLFRKFYYFCRGFKGKGSGEAGSRGGSSPFFIALPQPGKGQASEGKAVRN